MPALEEKPVPSPCVDICALDEQDVCIGCYRHGKEISYWTDYSNAQKQMVLERCRQRYQGNFISFLAL